MATLAEEIDDALSEMEDFAGETVTIYGDGASTYTGMATVTGGAVNFDMVTGGAYAKDAYTMTLRKTLLGAFVPAAGMLVDARGKELRIPDDGVTDARSHFRVEVCGRSVPR